VSNDADISIPNAFQGGNWQDLHRMLDVKGDRILFVGDHILADILRSKKSLGE
jgi:5'-nucleotidase